LTALVQSRLGLQRQAVHAALLATDSATAVLETLCGGPVSVRRRAPDAVQNDPESASLLHVAAGETVVHRQVDLLCGARQLSEADLWYVPQRLPHDIATRLRETCLPFGRVVRVMALRRISLSARLCDDGEPWALEHRALLGRPGGQPVAVVHERYGWGLFTGS
jgi:chorismate-pyruvate lyase